MRGQQQENQVVDNHLIGLQCGMKMDFLTLGDKDEKEARQLLGSLLKRMKGGSKK